jgi:catechol 2,3-dioxygenase-like lactoylglutathione lyase family enzyme
MSDHLARSPVAFHFSLNVMRLDRAIEFYRVLFGVEPAKRHDDYAKFELTDPPVVFSLSPHPPGPGGSLSHLGLRVASQEEIERIGQRLSAAGIGTQGQSGTICGYARQDKLWIRDPDGNFWEVYVVEEDVEPQLVRSSLTGPAARLDVISPGERLVRTSPASPRNPARDNDAPCCDAGPVVWEHYISSPRTGPIPHGDGSVDEVRLTGTFNAPLDEAARQAIVRESLRVLKAGGRIVIHGLMGDRPLSGSQPKLPGLAALVSRVPARDEPIALLSRLGFVGIQFTKLTDKPWFVHEGAGLREVKLVAHKPLSAAAHPLRRVFYKGPFAQAAADGGHTFARGERTAIPLALWQQLRLGPSAEQFVFLDAGEASACAATRSTPTSPTGLGCGRDRPESLRGVEP